MLFNSIHYIIYFIIVTLIYFIIPHSKRWILLLISSYYFYMTWNSKYVLLILIFTIINYFSAIEIYISKSKIKKQFYLYLSIIISFSILFIFKYLNFTIITINDILNLISNNIQFNLIDIILPVGISFYTFQTVGYVIDVYNKKIKPEKHFGIFALYVSFFPQLVAGPIERAKNLLPQFYEKHYFNYNNFISGFKLIIWGFFLKVVIADRLAIVVNTVYNNIQSYSGIPIILATYFFAFQIFCDFAGYSFIAIGSAKILGFNLMENFKRPYFARNIKEFWSRWHISLSTWFKDYIYIPLGGNRVKISRLYFNLMVVFIISGIWHGANWTFILWGILHGIYMIFNSINTRNIKNKLYSVTNSLKIQKLISFFEIIITFHLVLFGWIFFRSNNLTDAIYIISHIFREINFNFSGIRIGMYWPGLIISFLSILIMEIIHLLQENKKDILKFNPNLNLINYILLIFLIVFILLFGIFDSSEFIYFQF